MVWGREASAKRGRESFFNETDTVTGGQVEISSNHVHVFFKHHSADGKDQLLSVATLFGKIAVDVESHHCDGFFGR